MQPEIVVVRTAEIAVGSIGESMSSMRAWLDHHRINLANFRSVSREVGKIAFDAHFRDVEQAERFRTAFGISDQSR